MEGYYPSLHFLPNLHLLPFPLLDIPHTCLPGAHIEVIGWDLVASIGGGGPHH